ncbi:hypothetical protein AURDEDRAFT_172724 [Auricularia subglabra TFB-10046 SS5]|nr:hypothetical protein AURDEDRAFT_172724 [Auricularia subglabra TFB-10046 SS5]
MACVAAPAHVLRLRAECHVVFNACLTLLCTWFRLHNDSSLVPILARNLAHCPVSGHGSTPFQVFKHSRPFEVYTSANLVLIAALVAGPKAPSTRAQFNKNFSDRAGRWPSKIDDLFPLGPRDTVTALLTFGETLSHHAPMMSFKEILCLARPVVLPILASDPNRRRFLSIIIGLLGPINGVKYPPDHWLSSRDTPVEELAAWFLHAILEGPGSHFSDHEQILGGDAAMLFAALAPAFNKLPDSTPFISVFAAWYYLLYKALPEPRAPLPIRVVQWLGSWKGANKGTIVELSVHGALTRIVRTRACVYCGVSSLRNEDGKALSFCAGCKLVLYCSKECQRNHWAGKGGRHPHKGACSILRRLDMHKYAAHEPEEFIEPFRRLGLTEDEMKTLWTCVTDTLRLLDGPSRAND